jgi:hypothetical protein
MMILEVCCAMCGKEKRIEVAPVGGNVDADKSIKGAGWIVQQNGQHLDIYCSKQCAA